MDSDKAFSIYPEPKFIQRIERPEALVVHEVQPQKLSEIHQFGEGNQNEEYQELYDAFRENTQQPIQNIRSFYNHEGVESATQRRLSDQDKNRFNTLRGISKKRNKGYQMKLPLRNDLAYLLFDNQQSKRKLKKKRARRERLLFEMPDYDDNALKRKTDQIYKDLLTKI